MFQFQTGSIKSKTLREEVNDKTQFQFQTGSIKRNVQHAESGSQTRFNSKLVRLKVAGVAEVADPSVCRGFNSKLVRLKEGYEN